MGISDTWNLAVKSCSYMRAPCNKIRASYMFKNSVIDFVWYMVSSVAIYRINYNAVNYYFFLMGQGREEWHWFDFLIITSFGSKYYKSICLE